MVGDVSAAAWYLQGIWTPGIALPREGQCQSGRRLEDAVRVGSLEACGPAGYLDGA